MNTARLAYLQTRVDDLEMYAWSSDYGMRAYLNVLNELAAERARSDHNAMAREYSRLRSERSRITRKKALS